MQIDGIRVIDLTRLLPGGYTSQLLAEMGADVIKVEDPAVGDYARNQPPSTPEDVGALFTAVNRGKRSIVLDLKSEKGLERLYRLVETADVFFEGFRPGVAERLGIDYESIREQNPEIVYCSLSGYGQTGPLRNQPGHDLNYAGVAGLLDMTRHDEDHRPPVPGFPMADLAAGLFAGFSIVSELLSQQLQPENAGNYLDVSMTDVGYAFGQVATLEALCGNDPRPGETTLTGKYPCYDVYETADERYVTLAALEPKFWREFCSVIGREDLVDEHMSSDGAVREALESELREVFRTRTRSEWRADFTGTEVPFGVVNTPKETLSDPHITSRGLVQTGPDGRSVPHPVFPVKTANGLEDELFEYPAHGEHTDEVLEELGY
ncbi:CaiB/BaiF CoA transferase family protein [Haloarchaeobius sp. TZWSO28]|uniref:CaiB/BaiF CoA transferase family protein n=1 Tax=Haloarchaeobius sp. TZWSO28 TaxID=3446119 RepID=UPI003EBD449A